MCVYVCVRVLVCVSACVRVILAYLDVAGAIAVALLLLDAPRVFSRPLRV